MRSIALALVVVAFAGGLAAQGRIPAAEEVNSCIAAQSAAQAPAADCVARAHEPCLDLAARAPMAALQCFLTAKADWSNRIAARMEFVAGAGGEDIAAIAGIEVKYDLLQNLLQCDRMESLTLLREDPSEATALQRARCEAVAAGLAYAKLVLQSRSLEAP